MNRVDRSEKAGDLVPWPWRSGDEEIWGWNGDAEHGGGMEGRLENGMEEDEDSGGIFDF